MTLTKSPNLGAQRSRRTQSEGTEEWLTVACTGNSVASLDLFVFWDSTPISLNE